ncbi:hypothetical protein [Hippea maritima]|uniref:Uncharacterized protein n=1 Tax=Hippea maritima (strain ATCC 700847 / DSM 10411 / MH2) TaxID=760142 RepID=F2LWG3_HIPMA|nr:hypothetical protein [Hippea maritima]AEA34072.1 hypothetical protein Hipma_1106 [Hippea maritima DSM 10411]
METLTICVPFFALPGMKETCSDLVGDQNLILRDILGLNPLRKGEYENGPYLEGFNVDGKLDYVFYFEEVEKIIEKQVYDQIYILFRAIYKPYQKETQHLVVGYYTVENTQGIEIAPGAYAITGTSAYFVDYKDALNITDIIVGYNLQDSIMKSNSQNHPEYKDWVNGWLEHIKSKENKLEAYIERSKKLRTLKTEENYKEKLEGCL